MVLFSASFGIIITLYPIARAAGTFYQSSKDNAVVNVSNMKKTIKTYKSYKFTFQGCMYSLWRRRRNIDCKTFRWWCELLEFSWLDRVTPTNFYFCLFYSYFDFKPAGNVHFPHSEGSLRYFTANTRRSQKKVLIW